MEATKTELLYMNRRPMAVEPTNWAMGDLPKLLSRAQPVAVDLQPGDATRYRLLLVPCHANFVGNHLRSFGIPPADAAGWLLVVKMDDREGTATWIPWDGREIDVYHTSYLARNEWSQVFLAWWLTQLVVECFGEFQVTDQ